MYGQWKQIQSHGIDGRNESGPRSTRQKDIGRHRFWNPVRGKTHSNCFPVIVVQRAFLLKRSVENDGSGLCDRAVAKPSVLGKAKKGMQAIGMIS